MENPFIDIILYALPSVLTALCVISIFAWARDRKLRREEEENSRIIGAEIQFNMAYEKIYAQRRTTHDPDYTEFVVHADKEPVKSSISLERYWGLVERYIGKTEEDLRHELSSKSM